jgi:hypothetical protein
MTLAVDNHRRTRRTCQPAADAAQHTRSTAPVDYDDRPTASPRACRNELA